jgi:predicted ATPase/class 3 adenylate cyclase
VDAAVSLVGETQPEQVMVQSNALPALGRAEVSLELTETGNAIVLGLSAATATAARQYRWPAWQATADTEGVAVALRSFVVPTVREQVARGLGHFVGELRHALPMFIRFTLDVPEGADEQAALDKYVTTVQTVLAENGGRVVSVEVGDKGNVIFAVYGVPITYGDDAVRAVSGALRLRELGRSMPGLTSQRFAISRGLVYSGIIGGEVRHEYSTIGDETNIASRLMKLANNGQILVTSAVRKEARKRVIFQELAPIAVKGRVEPIPIAQPVGLRTKISHKLHLGAMVGREAEMAQFRKLVSAVGHGYPRILRVEGHAGIGKSRLLAEAVRYAKAQDFQAFGGTCLNTGQHIPYFVWREVLTGCFSLKPEFDDVAIVQRVSELICQMDEGWLPRLPLLRELLQVDIPDTPLTAGLEGRTRSQATMTLITDILLQVADLRPLLISLEDTQWLDEVSEALTIDLARRLMVEPAPIFLILIHRSLHECDHPPTLLNVISDMHIHTWMGIQELTHSEVHAITERYLNAAVPPDLAQFVSERSQGNPFFVHEMLDTLLETGNLAVVGVHVKVNGSLAQIDLPQTVQGLIQARIDHLGELDKLMLKVASVIGREFEVRVLAASLPAAMDNGEFEGRLQTLVEREFIYASLNAPVPTYQFKHVMTQEVAYQTIPFTQRQALHLAVATALVEVAPESVEALAHHYSRAGDAAQACRYLFLAGQKAFREFAPQSALAYFTEAQHFATEDVLQAEIIQQQLEVLARLGDLTALNDHIQTLEALATRFGRIDWKAIVYLYRAHMLVQTSAWQEAIEAAREVITFASELKDEGLAWNAYRLMRSCFRSLHQDEAAMYLSGEIGGVVTRLDDKRASIHFVLMQIEDLLTGPLEAEALDTAFLWAHFALEEAEQMNDLVLEADCHAMLATLYHTIGNLPEALVELREQVAELRQLGDRRNEGLALNRMGSVLIGLGLFSEANHHLLDAYRLLRQMGERAGEAASLVYLGIIAEHYRAPDEALAYLNRGLVIQKTLSAFVDSALTLFHMGNCYTARGEYDDAMSAFVQARSVLRHQARKERVVEVELGLAEVAMRRGDRDRALGFLQTHGVDLCGDSCLAMTAPGLAFWRAALILRTYAEHTLLVSLLTVYQTYFRAALAKIKDEPPRKAFRNIWYHLSLNTLADALLPDAEPSE